MTRRLLIALVLVMVVWLTHPLGLKGGQVGVVLACCESDTAGYGPVGQPRGPWRDQIHWVVTHDADGDPVRLYTRICRPLGEQPAPVVVINHGTPSRAANRKTHEPTSCDGEAARWFLERGYVVVAGLRRGHGASGGAYDEGASPCGAADFVRSAAEASRDIDAFVEYAARLPFAQPNGMVVIGQSTGGWSTIGYNTTRPHPRVNAMINMAGGRGGHVDRIPNKNCGASHMVEAAGILGQTASTPMLWVYTLNDTYFGPSLANAMYDAYVEAGGVADLAMLPPFGDDGHELFFGRGGSTIWGPLVEKYLSTRVAAG